MLTLFVLTQQHVQRSYDILQFHLKKKKLFSLEKLAEGRYGLSVSIKELVKDKILLHTGVI